MTPKEVRHHLGFTQREMAQAMGVHLMTWSKWEHEQRTPYNSAKQLMALLCWLQDERVKTLAQWRKTLPKEEGSNGPRKQRTRTTDL